MPATVTDGSLTTVHPSNIHWGLQRNSEAPIVLEATGRDGEDLARRLVVLLILAEGDAGVSWHVVRRISTGWEQR
jgi:hypothetical protein